jgi:hypothetical protein
LIFDENVKKFDPAKEDEQNVGKDKLSRYL